MDVCSVTFLGPFEYHMTFFSDYGPQVMSWVWIFDHLEVTFSLSPRYYPQTNSQTDRYK